MKYEVLRDQTKVGSYEFEELKALYQAGVLLPNVFFGFRECLSGSLCRLCLLQSQR